MFPSGTASCPSPSRSSIAGRVPRAPRGPALSMIPAPVTGGSGSPASRSRSGAVSSDTPSEPNRRRPSCPRLARFGPGGEAPVAGARRVHRAGQRLARGRGPGVRADEGLLDQPRLEPRRTGRRCGSPPIHPLVPIPLERHAEQEQPADERGLREPGSRDGFAYASAKRVAGCSGCQFVRLNPS